jgi:hypothetical protein
VFDGITRLGNSFCDSDEERRIFGPTACHNGIDRDDPRSDLSVSRKQNAQHLIRRALGVLQEFFHLVRRGRDYGEPVSEVIFIKISVHL